MLPDITVQWHDQVKAKLQLMDVRSLPNQPSDIPVGHSQLHLQHAEHVASCIPPTWTTCGDSWTD